MTLKQVEHTNELIHDAGINLGDHPYSVKVPETVVHSALKDPEKLLDYLSSEVGRVVDGLMDRLPTREQLLDFVFEKVAEDFKEVYQLPIENPYREEVPPFDPDTDVSPSGGVSLATVDKILKENFQSVLKAELEGMWQHAEKVWENWGGVHPVSKGPSPIVTSQAMADKMEKEYQALLNKNNAEFAKKNFQEMGGLFPDEWGGSPFVKLNPVPGHDLYTGVLNSPFGHFDVILDPTMPANQIRVGTQAYKGLETFSKPLNEVHKQYQDIIQKLQYSQPVKFVVEPKSPLDALQAKKTQDLLNHAQKNHWWKKEGKK